MDDRVKEYGEIIQRKDEKRNLHGIAIMTIIGEIEGHEMCGNSTKATKYEHLIPRIAEVELDPEVEGLLLVLNTCGGDVDAGLAIAELIASIRKPTVSLVLGGSHSIGVPIAVSTDYSYIVPTGTMVIHPVRMNGTVIGAKQTYDYIEQIQNRIVSFVTDHSSVTEDCFLHYMMATQNMSKDIGTILTGTEAVNAGIIDELGGLSDALAKLISFIEKERV